MSFLSSWRTALRVARREARRSKGRSALVVAMIGLPVLCLAFAAVSYDMFALTASEKADRAMGTGDARISWQSRTPIGQTPDGVMEYGEGPRVTAGTSAGEPPSKEADPAPSTSDLAAAMPPGTTILRVRKGIADVKTADGRGRLNAISVDATTPLTKGFVSILDGRAPTASNEVALTKQAVARIGVGLGGTVTSGDKAHSYTVVGLVEFPSLLEQALLFAPITGELPSGFSFDDESWIVDTPAPISWSQVQNYNRQGMLVTSRDVLEHPPAQSEIAARPSQTQIQDFAAGTLIAGLALLEVVLLAGPAFAVGARRRQRQLALVAANGGTPSHVRRIVLADGVVLGLVSAIVGIALGIVAAFAARPYIEEGLAHSRAGGYRVFPVALVAITVLAIGTGLIAALVPAFITARQNVVASLAGRRGITRSKKRWLILGLAMASLGTVIVAYGTADIRSDIMLVGLIVGELGLVLCTPAMVGLIARVGRILPIAPRIALRDAARNRAAAAPAISAVMAAVAGSVALGLYLESDQARNQATAYLQLPVGYASVYIGEQKGGGNTAATPVEIERVSRATLPVTEVKTISSATCGGAPFGKATPGQASHQCTPALLMDPAQVCPYSAKLRETENYQLTGEQAHAARADPRCRDQQASFYAGGLTVDDGDALAVMTGASPDQIAAATAVLRAGGVVVTDPRYLTDGKAVLAVIEFDVDANGATSLNPEDHLADAKRYSFPGYVLSTPVDGTFGVISSAAAAAANLTKQPTQMLVATSRYPTQAEQDRFQQEAGALGSYGFVQGPSVNPRNTDLWIIMAASAVITLGAAGIGTGLAAADGRADLSTLASVGASPRMRRGLSLSQSAVIAGLGSLLGAGAGLGAAVAVLVAINRRWADIWPGPTPMPLTVPWLSLGAALLVVPALAMLGAGALTRSRLPIERRI
jgi:putative ABC transport system permease protein